jgi:hypothetical protein
LIAALGPRHVAVHFSTWRATTLLAAYWFFANAIEGANLACFVLVAPTPGRTRTALGAIFSNVARRSALVQHGAQGQCWLRCSDTSDFTQFFDCLFPQRFTLATAQGTRQLNRAVTNALEAANEKSLGIP